MLPNSTAVPLAAVALTWKPVPGVEKTTPRGEFTLKKFAGRLFGADRASGTPSQLISRRPLGKEPATFAFNAPRAVRYASTVAWMPAAFAPDALKVTAAPNAVGETRPKTAAKMSRFLMFPPPLRSRPVGILCSQRPWVEADHGGQVATCRIEGQVTTYAFHG